MRGEVVAVKRGVTFMSVKNVWVYRILAIYGYVIIDKVAVSNEYISGYSGYLHRFCFSYLTIYTLQFLHYITTCP